MAIALTTTTLTLSGSDLPPPMVRAENTQHWGNDHCTAGLWFNNMGFDQNIRYTFFVGM